MKFCKYRKLNTIYCNKDIEFSVCPYLFSIINSSRFGKTPDFSSTLWKNCSRLDKEKVPIIREEDLKVK